MTRVRDLHAGWMKDPEYRKEYDALDEEFALAAALIRARAEAGLTQEQLAERMGTKQEVVARWEGGKVLPSTRTLMRLAKATGTTLRISFTRAHAGATPKRSGHASCPPSNRHVA
ncbi:MAG TPA: helix-turn-helix transcriptional regulator [Acetobacteraceae bacterium]|jgi:ribosome-binding protein aMBF1 (putative translation factor)|nr:helix-turn-helix transcriptional regulator [Acetobacteraceae bacterium]